MITYRDKRGAKREEALEAASRTECVAECRRRGVLPIAIREGGRAVAPRPPQTRTDCTRNNADSDGAGRRPYQMLRSRFLAVLGTLVFLAILGGTAWWYMTHDGSFPESDNRPKPLNPVASNNVNESTGKVEVASLGKKRRQAPAEPIATTNGVRTYLGKIIVDSVQTTNRSGYIIERIRTVDGKIHRVTHYPPPMFECATDEYLATILSVPPGMAMAPLPDFGSSKELEKEFYKSLEKEIKIEDGDNQRTKELKIKVIAARESMKVLLSQGWKFSDVLEQERKNINTDVETRSMVIAHYKELLAKGFTEDAEKYRGKVNKTLEGSGIPPIKKQGEKHK